MCSCVGVVGCVCARSFIRGGVCGRAEVEAGVTFRAVLIWLSAHVVCVAVRMCACIRVCLWRCVGGCVCVRVGVREHGRIDGFNFRRRCNVSPHILLFVQTMNAANKNIGKIEIKSVRRWQGRFYFRRRCNDFSHIFLFMHVQAGHAGGRGGNGGNERE